MKTTLNKQYFPFLAVSILALLFALWAGLLRLGWALPGFGTLAMSHGPLMVSGFLGLLIPLERAVAIRKKWMFAVPIASGLGWLALFFAPLLGAFLFTLCSLGTVAILVYMARREPHLHTFIILLGGLAWTVGNILWLLGHPIFQLVLFWEAFLVLTIAGERLELSRILRPSPGAVRLLGLVTAAFLVGAALALVNLRWGSRLCGLSMLGLSFWFLKNDLATRNLRHPNPLTRYIAVCLFAGFIWLGAGGAFNLYYGALYAGPKYDAALHAVFLGFVISMIFGHAPIIFPAILGAPITFQRAFYAQLGLLHLSLGLRIAGDLFNSPLTRQWGGLLNEVALLLFLGMTIFAVWTARRA